MALILGRAVHANRYMGTENVHMRYQPTRVGLLVRDGEVADIVKAAGLHSLIWGGIYNPIIPVGKDASLAEKWIKIFKVDVLHAVTDDPALKQVLNAHPYLSTSDNYSREFIVPHEQQPHYVDVLNIVNHYWNTDIKHKEKGYVSNARLIKWDQSDALANVFALTFGFYPGLAELKNDYAQAFVKGLRAQELIIPTGASIDKDIFYNLGPIQLTGQQLPFRQNGAGNISNGDGLYFGDVNCFTDLIWFWNLRAMGSNVYFLPLKHHDRLEGLITEYIGRSSQEDLNGSGHFEILYSEAASLDAIKGIIEKKYVPPPGKKFLYYHCETSMLNGLNGRPWVHFQDWETSIGAVEKNSDSDWSVHFNLPEKGFINKKAKQHLVVHVDSFSDWAHQSSTLKPPYIPELNEYCSREICLDPYSLRVDEDGVRILIEASDTHLLLRPLHYSRIIAKTFAAAGIKAVASQPGVIAQRLVEHMGGLDGCRVFKIQGVRKLISGFNPDDMIDRGAIFKTINNNNQFKAQSEMYIEPRTEREMRPEDVFRFLLRKGLLRTGVKLQCVNCNLEDWFSLNDLADTWSCRFCGHSDKTAEQLKDKNTWRYRKSGLLAKNNNQEGAVPVILTLWLFDHTFHHNSTYSTALNLEFDGKKCEIDFCVVHKSLHYNNTEMVIGECKSAGGRIEQVDVDNLVFVRNKMKGLGINCYLAFSKVDNTYTAEELNLIRPLIQKHVPVIILSNLELEPYFIYEGIAEAEKAKLFHAHPITLSDFAANSGYYL